MAFGLGSARGGWSDFSYETILTRTANHSVQACVETLGELIEIQANPSALLGITVKALPVVADSAESGDDIKSA